MGHVMAPRPRKLNRDKVPIIYMNIYIYSLCNSKIKSLERQMRRLLSVLQVFQDLTNIFPP